MSHNFRMVQTFTNDREAIGSETTSVVIDEGGGRFHRL